MSTGTVRRVVTEHSPQAMSLPEGDCGPSYSAETENDIDSQFASAGGGGCLGRREGCAGGFSLVGNERHVGWEELLGRFREVICKDIFEGLYIDSVILATLRVCNEPRRFAQLRQSSYHYSYGRALTASTSLLL